METIKINTSNPEAITYTTEELGFTILGYQTGRTGQTTGNTENRSTGPQRLHDIVYDIS